MAIVSMMRAIDVDESLIMRCRRSRAGSRYVLEVGAAPCPASDIHSSSMKLQPILLQRRADDDVQEFFVVCRPSAISECSKPSSRAARKPAKQSRAYRSSLPVDEGMLRLVVVAQ